MTLSASRPAPAARSTVSGTGWRPRTLLMMLSAARATPARGVIGGTNSCANGDGRAGPPTPTAASAGGCRSPSRRCPALRGPRGHRHRRPGRGGHRLGVAGHPAGPAAAERSALAVLSDTG
ncbi:hypothetical protein GCM10017687_74380 [Streptomyces echinatus]|uniref:hypothetical protein n=1 Tax=Streptomyces echinatus TaxID=67293 RepID=UPI0031EBABAE